MAGLVVKIIISIFLLSACQANLKVKSVGGAAAINEETTPNVSARPAPPSQPEAAA